MIRHIIILHFQKDLHEDYLSLLEQTRPMLDQIPGITSFQVFRNESRYVPEDIQSVGVEMFFADEAALDVFMKHPKHHEANSIFEKYLADPPFMVLTHEI